MRTFTLTDDHIALLRRANVRWNPQMEGAPCLDPKRPYGNSDSLADVAAIVGIEPAAADAWDEPAFTSKQQQALAQLHRQTEAALQIVLCTGAFVPGIYEADDYMSNWRLRPGAAAEGPR